MSSYNQCWDDLGRDIQQMIDRAVNSNDYQRLNQSIRQSIGQAANMGNEIVRKVVHNPQSDTRNENLPVLYADTRGRHSAAILEIIFGSFLSSFAFAGTLGVAAVGDWLITPFLVDVLLKFGIGGMAVGGALLGVGVSNARKVKRFRTYRRVLGDKTHCTLEKLARSVGKNVKFVRREVARMIDAGLFLEGHLNHEQTCLIVSDETYRDFEHNRKQLEERMQPEAEPNPDSQVQQVLDRGNAFIAQIRKCNDDIPGEEISAKIYHTENLVQRIFDRAKTHPEVVPDLQKLMDYYLPMTIKLLNAYAEMDGQPVQGETIQNSKREIEATLDTINAAFENLLDDLFKDVAMDVSSDISVLQTLLAQEGLMEDDFSQMKKEL